MNGEIIDWNNCHTSEQLESISAHKNDLGVDCVSRQFMYELGATCIATRNEKGELIAIVAIEALPPVTPQEPRWIPVSERLPEESHNSVLGWDAYRERCVMVQYLDGRFQIAGKTESFDIRAWMPLPKLYEPQESEDNNTSCQG